jgi:hypothetical protein
MRRRPRRCRWRATRRAAAPAGQTPPPRRPRVCPWSATCRPFPTFPPRAVAEPRTRPPSSRRSGVAAPPRPPRVAVARRRRPPSSRRSGVDVRRRRPRSPRRPPSCSRDGRVAVGRSSPCAGRRTDRLCAGRRCPSRVARSPSRPGRARVLPRGARRHPPLRPECGGRTGSRDAASPRNPLGGAGRAGRRRLDRAGGPRARAAHPADAAERPRPARAASARRRQPARGLSPSRHSGSVARRVIGARSGPGGHRPLSARWCRAARDAHPALDDRAAIGGVGGRKRAAHARR